MTRKIFPEDDDHLYKYVEDDGDIVEPEFYLPIIPMALVNGCEGIGTGWSTSVPNYNPHELINVIRAKLNGQEFGEIHPWYKGFSGQIIACPNKSSYNVYGEYDIDHDNNSIEITELPVRLSYLIIF